MNICEDGYAGNNDPEIFEITKEQFQKICYALTLGDYFVQDQEPSGEQYNSDKETMEDAWAVIREIEVQS